MSEVASRVREVAEDCLVRACWRQWKAIAEEGWTASEPVARSIIDPEALMLASLCVQHREARLRDRTLWWARTGAQLMSVPRMRALMKQFMPDVSPGIARFAAETGDARWARLASEPRSDEPVRPGKGPSELRLFQPASLMLRLRAGFGVGAKSDLLTFLIGVSSVHHAEVHATARTISLAIHFSDSSVRRAASDMCLAGMIEGSRDRPPSYSLDVDAWAYLLGLRTSHRGEDEGIPSRDLPAWRFWSQLYALLAACSYWGNQVIERATHPSVQSSMARDISEEFARWTRITGWRDVEARSAPGARYLEAFEGLVLHVSEWVDRNL